MTYPKYFSHFPDITYAKSINKAGKIEYQQIKSYFHRMQVRDDLFKEDTLYYLYDVQNGMRPEQIAYEEYGDEGYYWVILQVNDIVDYYKEWPLTQYELDTFIVEKYGSYQAAEDIHHYETTETKNEDGEIVLDGGIVVQQNFIFEYPNNFGDTTFFQAYPAAVTNRMYEYRENEKKTQINLLKKEYLGDFISEYVFYANDIDPELLVSQLKVSNYLR